MSNLYRLLKDRRSIRKYLPDMPPAEWIEEMVTCAACAPSPSHSQPVRFFNIASQKKKEDLFNAIAQGRERLLHTVDDGTITAGKRSPKKLKNLIQTYYRYSIFMFEAPLIFAVGTISNVSGFSKKLFDAGLVAENIRGNTDLDISVGLALKGFILKATELGLGTCILTSPLTFAPDASEILGLSDIRLTCFVSVGFADETPSPIFRKPISEIYREI